MQAGAILLLLIGVVNLANLLLVSVSVRSRELAVRQALGASRRRLAIELLIEVAMLTFAGAALGLALGAAGARQLPVLGVDQLPLGAQISFDSRVALSRLLLRLRLRSFSPRRSRFMPCGNRRRVRRRLPHEAGLLRVPPSACGMASSYHALPSVRNPCPNIGCGHRASHRSVLLRLPDSFAPSGVHLTD